MKKTFTTMLVAVMAVAMVALIGCVKEENNKDGGNAANNGGSNGGGTANVEWIDLGLPSGVLWAECNVGATAPEESGEYFAWGEIATKDAYNWITYCYCTVEWDRSLSTLTKYNTSTTYGTPDSLLTLVSDDDAATAILGDGARTPTKEEWQELMDKTSVEWTTINDVNGRKFTAANGNSIFLPAAGYRPGYELVYADSIGYYWSASLYTDEPSCAWEIGFYSTGQGMGGAGRYNGLPVRAVRAR